MQQKNNPALTPYAQKLRKTMTKEERLLWYNFLRSLPVGFKRQKVIGPSIVDFYCPAAKLVIEVDGSQHYEEAGKEADASRDDYLSSLGLRVLRYSNLDINRDFPAVCDDILNHLPEERTNAFPYEGKVARR